MSSRRPKPKPKRNGGCATCGKQRPDLARAERDPFCSVACAKSYYGVVNTTEELKQQMGEMNVTST